MDVKITALEDREDFVQEMSESLTRELNTLTKSLANVQMEGETSFIFVTTINFKIFCENYFFIFKSTKTSDPPSYKGLNSNQTVWEEVMELRAALETRITVI